MDNSKASIIASVEPVAASVLGFFVFDEKISFNGFLGMVFVLGAIILCNIKLPDKKRNQE